MFTGEDEFDNMVKPNPLWQEKSDIMSGTVPNEAVEDVDNKLLGDFLYHWNCINLSHQAEGFQKMLLALAAKVRGQLNQPNAKFKNVI